MHPFLLFLGKNEGQKIKKPGQRIGNPCATVPHVTHKKPVKKKVEKGTHRKECIR